jgi:hypothetical protein
MRRSIPTYVPLTETATERHQAGMSCVNRVIYRYNANGHQRWCWDCGAKLGYDEPTRRVNWLLFLPFVLVFLFAAAFFLLVNAGIVRDGDPVTPTTYGPPSVVHSMP